MVFKRRGSLPVLLQPPTPTPTAPDRFIEYVWIDPGLLSVVEPLPTRPINVLFTFELDRRTPSLERTECFVHRKIFLRYVIDINFFFFRFSMQFPWYISPLYYLCRVDLGSEIRVKFLHTESTARDDLLV